MDGCGGGLEDGRRGFDGKFCGESRRSGESLVEADDVNGGI